MKTANIELLSKRIEGLEATNFDLDGWKSGTTLLLTRIFGEGNAYTKEIKNLKVDYSSWSLRDATSDYNPKEACKRSGKEIVELAIAELNLTSDKKISTQQITDLLQDKSGSIEAAITKGDEQALLALLKKSTKDQLTSLLAKLLIV